MKQLFKFLFLFTFIFTIFSCNQEKDPDPNTEDDSEATESVLDAIASDDIVQDLNAQVQTFIAAIANGRVKNGAEAQDSCATIDYDLRQSTITVDFGEGCTGPLGLVRKGQIVITYNGFPGISPVSWVLTTQNFTLNDTQVQGEISGSGIEILDGDIVQYTLSHDLITTFPDAKSITSQGRIRTKWLEGFGDEDISNDVLEFTGATTGTNRRGQTISKTIVEPVVRKIACTNDGQLPAVSGIETLQIGLLGNYSIDYGDGACDRRVVITTPNRSFPIDLP